MSMAASPPLRPEIKDVMQVDVRQQGRGNAALRRPHLWPGHLPIFHHPSLQPFTDQADHAAVADPMLDKTDQPLVVDRVEEPGNIGVQYGRGDVSSGNSVQEGDREARLKRNAVSDCSLDS